MITEDDKQMLKAQIQATNTERYLAAYYAGVGANIQHGDKKARIAGRAAGRVALEHAGSDLDLDQQAFAAACQKEYDAIMLKLTSQVETPKAGLIVPAAFAKPATN